MSVSRGLRTLDDPFYQSFWRASENFQRSFKLLENSGCLKGDFRGSQCYLCD